MVCPYNLYIDNKLGELASVFGIEKGDLNLTRTESSENHHV